MKSLFQHYCQHLGLNHNHISVKSLFNFYINKRIAYLLGISVNTESAKETFYYKLIQNTSLPTNHNFASIITEINKEIEHYTQQRYPIIYSSKGKGKLQTPAVTPQWIQPPTWKKHRVESPTNPSYHYTPGSTIHITLPNTIADSWEASESKEEKESENQEFTYQNLISENPEVETPNVQTPKNTNQENPEIETPNIQIPWNQNILNSDLINQLNLSPNIVINQPPIEPIIEPIQLQSLQLPQQPQQLLSLPQQQFQLQQPPQQYIVAPIVYAPIAKIKKFTDKENNVQVWLNNIEKVITANG
ncbi:hypothetical protein G9A89_005762 [Geosiphon pyriformis]|nr:hypothetical protein G9A89_005762 [Geosiphon pyriformis]